MNAPVSGGAAPGGAAPGGAAPGGAAPGGASESLEELFGTVFDLAGQLASRISPDVVEARLRRTLEGADSPVAALVNRAAAGDSGAWNQIVERYAPLVYAVCTRYRLSKQDIEDVGQRVWLLLVQQIGQLREPAALPGWLATTTARECLRTLRAAQRSGRLANSVPLAEDPAIDARILTAERDAALHAALAELPDRCQRLLAMLTSDPPHSYAEISAALRIPIGSIGPQRTRCLDRLRRSMPSLP